MVQHSVRLWREFDERMRTPSHAPRAWFRQRGYLFLADDATSAALAARADAQQAAGAVQQRLNVDEIAALVPGLKLDDIRWGLFGPEDGYANPREVLFGLRAAAVAAGAEYVHDEVIGVDVAGGRVTGVRLAHAGRLDAPVVVNAAGALSGRVAALAGLAVPVEPVRQLLFRCTLPRLWPTRFPMVVDPGGVHWRHDDAVGARRARSHHAGLHQVGRAGRRMLRLRRGALGAPVLPGAGPADAGAGRREGRRTAGRDSTR